jgi:hypothetical protein
MESVALVVVGIALLVGSSAAAAAVSWFKFPNTDTGPASLTLTRAATCGIWEHLPPCNITFLQEACLDNPLCMGFNSDGHAIPRPCALHSWLSAVGTASRCLLRRPAT